MSKAIYINFENDALMSALTKYRKSKGWTWKRLVLVGLAESINKDGDSDELLLAIVEYLESRR